METFITVTRDHHRNGWRPLADDMVVTETDRLVFGDSLVTLHRESPYIGQTQGQISRANGSKTTFARYHEQLDRRIN